MGKRSRRLKRAAATVITKVDSVPGGLMGAQHRARNGQATMQDVGFLLRVSRELKGQDGYLGEAKGSKGTFVSSDHSISRSSYWPDYSSQVGDKYKLTSTTPKSEDGVFHCKENNEITSSCPLNPKVPSILVEAVMWDCFINCAKEYDSEWIALLIGRLDKDSKGEPAYVIEKFYFPPQVASGAHVEVPTGVKPRPGTIGAIHSHVAMQAFWSATDKAHSNWPVEVVINRKGDYEALSRYQLKCGEWAKSKASVYLTGSYVNATIKGMLDKAFVIGEGMGKKGRDITINIHPEDKDDVVEAIVTTSTSTTPTSTSTNRSNSLTEEVCPVLNCVRENGHKGYCRNKENDYFPNPGFYTQGEISFDPTSDDPTDHSKELASDEMCQDCEGVGLVESSQGGTPLTAVTCPTCKGDGFSELGRVRAREDEKYSQLN